MVLPVLAVLWLAGRLDNMGPATKAVTQSFYICMAVRPTCLHCESVPVCTSVLHVTRSPHKRAGVDRMTMCH